MSHKLGTEQAIKHIRDFLKKQGLALTKRDRVLKTFITPESRAYNQDRMTYPWGIVKPDPYASRARTDHVLVAKYRTLEEVADAYGIDLTWELPCSAIPDEILQALDKPQGRLELAELLEVSPKSLDKHLDALEREGKVVRTRVSSSNRAEAGVNLFEFARADRLS